MSRYEVGPEVIAVLLNPKTRELVEVVRGYGSRDVYIRHPGTEGVIGSAYLDSSETFEVGGNTYSRSHSPSSGVEKGKGYGVVLYSGLCLLAYSYRDDGIASSDGGEGIEGESHSGRSEDASRFWERCVENGLAEESYFSAEEEKEIEDVEYDPELECYDVPDETCSYVVSTSGRVDITYVGIEDKPFQYMPATLVAENKFIFATPGVLRDFDFDPIPPDVLVTLNLSNCYDAGLADLVLEYAIEGGYSLEFVERLARSLPKSVYLDTFTTRQLKLDYTANKNRALEREIDEVWEETYGGLADID